MACAGMVELGKVHLAETEVGAWVEGAAVRDHPGVREQPSRLPLAVTKAREPADLLGHLRHLLAGLQEPLGVAPIDMTDVERDQAPGGVEHVDGGCVGTVGVADGVAEHRPQPRRPGEAGHPGGVRRRPRAGPGQPVGDQLDEQVGTVGDRQPRRERGMREIVAAQRHGAAELGAGTEHHHHVSRGDLVEDVLGDQVEGAHRPSPLAGQVGGRDQPADRGPAAPAAGQERRPGQLVVAERPAAHRGPGVLWSTQ